MVNEQYTPKKAKPWPNNDLEQHKREKKNADPNMLKRKHILYNVHTKSYRLIVLKYMENIVYHKGQNMHIVCEVVKFPYICRFQCHY